MSGQQVPVGQGPRRFMDQCEANAEVERWIGQVVAQLPPGGDNRIEQFGLRLADPTAQPNGRVTVIWSGSHQVGLATVVRDDWNWSVLTITEADPRGVDIPARSGRRSDMDPRQALVLTCEADGDILVGLGQAPRFLALEALQFCTAVGGGQSPRTLAALRQLAWAMQQDDLDTPAASVTRSPNNDL